MRRCSSDPLTPTQREGENDIENRTLTGLDSAFLALETNAAPMHMTAVAVLEPAAGRSADFDEIRAHLAPRLARLPVFRRRPQEVPLGLDHPTWVEEDFDLDAHFHRVAVPEPGSQAEFTELVGHLAAVPLDRTRPLWEMWVVEGLAGGRTGLVAKIHHALIDGVAGAEVLGRLLDVDQDAGALDGVEPVDSRSARARPPSSRALLRRAVRSFARRPFDVARQTWDSLTAAARGVRSMGTPARPTDALPAAALSAPDTPLSGAITARREVALGSVSLEDLADLKSRFGVKLNDVVLELCAATLRSYLSRDSEAPRDPLVAAIPISVAKDPEGRTTGNEVSVVTVELPVHLSDPVGRLSKIHRETLRAKRAHRAVGGDLLSGWAEVAPPILLSGLSDLYSRLDLADRHRPVVNLIVSNIAGPDFPLYCAGHAVEACYPLGPIYEGCALNLTVMSYDGRVHFGWTACPDALPAIGRMADALDDAVADLREQAPSRRSDRRIAGGATPRVRAPLYRGRRPNQLGAIPGG